MDSSLLTAADPTINISDINNGISKGVYDQLVSSRSSLWVRRYAVKWASDCKSGPI